MFSYPLVLHMSNWSSALIVSCYMELVTTSIQEIFFQIFQNFRKSLRNVSCVLHA